MIKQYFIDADMNSLGFTLLRLGPCGYSLLSKQKQIPLVCFLQN